MQQAGRQYPGREVSEGLKSAERAGVRCEELGVSTAPVPGASLEKRERVGRKGIAEQCW
jgi:hypothetical protein